MLKSSIFHGFFRWYNQIKSYSGEESKKFPGVKDAAKYMSGAAAAADDDDDDVDLFGSDDEEEEESEEAKRVREERLAAYAAKKSKKGEILDAGEDEQLAAAIRASLAESQPKNAGGADEGDSEYRDEHDDGTRSAENGTLFCGLRLFNFVGSKAILGLARMFHHSAKNTSTVSSFLETSPNHRHR